MITFEEEVFISIMPLPLISRGMASHEVGYLFWKEFQPRTGTKFGGYPAWSQDPDVPSCSCGKEKDFIFQLSSEDLEDGQERPPPSGRWSAHGIMIGDVGNLCFFLCKDCGEKTLETKWDCG